MDSTQDTATRLRAHLKSREPEMLALLEELVNIDGGSYDKEGVDAVGLRLAAFLEAEGIPVRRDPVPNRGDNFLAELPSRRNGQAPVLLMGHRDTVFPAGEPARRPFRIEGGRAYGPGVADMKAGLVMNAFVIAAFRALDLPHPPIRLLMTGDEEIGSHAGRPAIEAAAAGCQAVFNAEPGRISGNVVTARRGGVFFRVGITGRAAHAGLEYERGRSAILALARKIEAWTALTDPDADITVNVGLISGGQSVNTVAPHATCEIDTRYARLADREALIAAIYRIAEEPSVPDTSATVENLGEFLPMTPTPEQGAVLKTYLAGAAAAGLNIAGEHTRSCADSGVTAALGLPTICATGPVGAHAHSPEEFLELDTVVPRAQALALTLLSLGES